LAEKSRHNYKTVLIKCPQYKAIIEQNIIRS
jgi:hypothetical protein